MRDRSGASKPQPSTRAQAIHTAATACDDHQHAPDSVTFHTMQHAVQTAQNLGATLHDIRAARGQQ
jgi:hypothetical protein